MRSVFLLSALCLIGPVPARAQAASDPAISVGAVAPRPVIADLDGKPVTVAVSPGKRAAVVEFWATWCEICRALLPTMRDAQKQFGTQVDFYGVNVTVNESRDRVKRYVADHAPPFRTLYDDKGVAVRAFDAQATSYVVIVDSKGRIAYTGDGSAQDIVGALRKVVSK